MSQQSRRQYQYYPGCSLHGTAREYHCSLKVVAERLDIDLRELSGWSCCGSTAARSLSEPLALALAVRNLARAQEVKLPLMVACNLCFSNLALAADSLRNDRTRKAVNHALSSAGVAYEGGVELLHPLRAIIEDIGIEQVAARVVRPLHGLRVVSYYGCLLTRPRQVALPESNFHPQWLDDLMAAIGAGPLPFTSKTRCCGGPLLMTHPEAAYDVARRLLDEARELGAQCIVTTCPQCHLSLGGKRSTIEKRFGTRYQIEVMYFTQLLGLALGASPRDLGLRCAAARIAESSPVG